MSVTVKVITLPLSLFYDLTISVYYCKMSNFDPSDQPEFDIVQFETDARKRAAELVAQVARLAIFATDEPVEWVVEKGGLYELPNGQTVALKHETWDQNPEKVVAKVKITHPYVESVGLDSLRRRVQLTRFIEYRSFIDIPDQESLAALEKELPPAPEVEESLNEIVKRIDQSRLEDQMSPSYRPDELIHARTSAIVECKLPNSPNYRTERYADTLPQDTKLAHIAARRRAGEPPAGKQYDIPEHKAVIALLGDINPHTAEPQPLDYDFDENWKSPEATLRSWMPESNERD